MSKENITAIYKSQEAVKKTCVVSFNPSLMKRENDRLAGGTMEMRGDRESVVSFNENLVRREREQVVSFNPSLMEKKIVTVDTIKDNMTSPQSSYVENTSSISYDTTRGINTQTDRSSNEETMEAVVSNDVEIFEVKNLVKPTCVTADDGTPITNFYLTAIVGYKGKEVEDEIGFEIVTAQGLVVATSVRMPISEFRVGNWYKRYLGLACYDIKLFQAYLEELCASNMKIQLLVQRSGWYEDGDMMRFITHTGDILAEEGQVNIADENSMKIFKSYTYSESQVASQFECMKQLAKTGVARIVQIYVLLAALFTLFKKAGVTPKGALFIVGARSTLKTSLVMVMAKLVNRKVGMEPGYNFECTATSLDEAAERHKDCCLIVDDFHPVENAYNRKRIEGLLEHITRVYGQSVQKHRSIRSVYGEIKAPEGLVIMTGEYQAGVSSSMSRRLQMSVERGDVNIDLLTYYQQNLDILPNFIYGFVRFVAANQNDIISNIQLIMNRYRAQSRDLYSASRYGETYAFLMTTCEVYLNYLSKLNVISMEESHLQMHEFSCILESYLLENDCLQSSKNPINQISKALVDLVDSGDGFTLLERKKPSDRYIADNFVYIKPEVLLQIVKESCVKQGIISAISDVTYLGEVLKREGWLEECREAGKVRFTHKIPGASAKRENGRFYKIALKHLEEK